MCSKDSPIPAGVNAIIRRQNRTLRVACSLAQQRAAGSPRGSRLDRTQQSVAPWASRKRDPSGCGSRAFRTRISQEREQRVHRNQPGTRFATGWYRHAGHRRTHHEPLRVDYGSNGRESWLHDVCYIRCDGGFQSRSLGWLNASRRGGACWGIKRSARRVRYRSRYRRRASTACGTH